MILASFQSLDLDLHNWALSLGWPLEGVFRLVLAAIVGGLVGVEREVSGREAGFRTNMLVCLGSALVMILSVRFAAVAWPDHPNYGVNVDPARIAYGVMTGIGFLGAGTIMQHRGSVRGLTTAAALWCVAAVGMTVGFGMYLLSIVAAVLIIFTLWCMDYIGNALPRRRFREVMLRVRYHPGCVAETVAKLRDAGLRVLNSGFERETEGDWVKIRLLVTYFDRKRYYDLESLIEGRMQMEVLSIQDSL